MFSLKVHILISVIYSWIQGWVTMLCNSALAHVKSENIKTFLGIKRFLDPLLELLLKWKCFLRICGFYLSAVWYAEVVPGKYRWVWLEDALRGTVLIYSAEVLALVVGLHSLKLRSRWPFPQASMYNAMSDGYVLAKGLSQNKSRCGFHGQCDLASPG